MIDLTPGFVLECLGAIGLLAFAWTLYRTAQAARWPRIDANVIASRVAPDTDLDKNMDPNERPVLRYRYEVRGTRHESDRLYAHGSVAMSGANARRLVARHPVGSSLRVRYNPGAPQDAALDAPLPRWVPALQLVAGIGFIVAGLALETGA